jgi:hypothetical protein
VNVSATEQLSPQHQALERATAVRRHRARLHAELRALPAPEARALLSDALREPPDWLHSLEVDRLLGWLPRVGAVQIDAWLEKAQLFERNRELRRVTERQRKLLCELLSGTVNGGNEGEGRKR